jgi:hypothetical protein
MSQNEETRTPNYWLTLFTYRTWEEFLEAGGNVAGFRERRWRTVQKMRPGDVLLCYLTGISRFIGILEVTGKAYQSYTSIWSEAVYPCRVPVRVLMTLRPEYGVPVTDLEGKLSYFRDMKTPYAWWGHFNASPTKERPADAAAIVEAMQTAAQNPVWREFDPRKLERKEQPLYSAVAGAVIVPEDDETDNVPAIVEELAEPVELGMKAPPKVTHEEIQYMLLHLGSAMGLDVWVARNDRGRSYDGKFFGDVANLRNSLPRQFDDATQRTIELIDVLWLRENTIVAAFEVEHTSAVYSGLLRMSDLIAMQPNINIDLYIVAPDERRDKVFAEINRPTFSRLKPPLREICRYIPYAALKNKVESARDFLQYLKPEFLDEMAESFDASV